MPKASLAIILGIVTLVAATAASQEVPLQPPVDPGPGVSFEIGEARVASDPNRLETNGMVTATCPSPAVYTEEVVFSVEALPNDPWVRSTVRPVPVVVSYEPSECLTGSTSYQSDVPYAVEFDDAAPAFTTTTLGVVATRDTGEVLGQANWTLEVPFFGAVAARVDEIYRESTPGVAEVQIVIDNEANAPITATLDVRRHPAFGAVSLPAPVNVGSENGTNARASVLYTYERAGEDEFVIEVAAAATERPEATLEPVELRVTIDSKNGTVVGEQVGGGNYAPTLAPGLIVVTLMLAAAWSARRPQGPFGKR